MSLEPTVRANRVSNPEGRVLEATLKKYKSNPLYIIVVGFPLISDTIITMNKSQLINLLAEQMIHAHSLDGIWGQDAAVRRNQACMACNQTMAQLEALGVDPEDAFAEAEEKQEQILSLAQVLGPISC